MSALEDLVNENNWEYKTDYGPYGVSGYYEFKENDPCLESAAVELAALRSRLVEAEKLLVEANGFVGYLAGEIDADKEEQILYEKISKFLGGPGLES